VLVQSHNCHAFWIGRDDAAHNRQEFAGQCSAARLASIPAGNRVGDRGFLRCLETAAPAGRSIGGSASRLCCSAPRMRRWRHYRRWWRKRRWRRFTTELHSHCDGNIGDDSADSNLDAHRELGQAGKGSMAWHDVRHRIVRWRCYCALLPVRNRADSENPADQF
jgi:hypothetical protein